MDFIYNGLLQGINLIFSGDEAVWSAVKLTLELTALSMCASLLIGLPLGFILGYFNFPTKSILRTIVDTCLSLPTVVVGLLVYAFISNAGPLGQYKLLFTIPGIAIGQTILALPIVIALTANAIESLDNRLRLTLLTLGAGAFSAAVTTLWEARYQVIAAAVTACGRITAEVGVSMMLGGNIKWRTRTITTAITLETNKGEFAAGIALGVILLSLALILNTFLAFAKRRDK
ncbi:MAG: ABC transporter permease [Synergistaceae bacterium]|nr:ABC transporter permease [Synergistaceae bacterium]